MGRRKKSARERAYRERISAAEMKMDAIKAKHSYEDMAARLFDLAAEVERERSTSPLERAGMNPWSMLRDALSDLVEAQQAVVDDCVRQEVVMHAVDTSNRCKSLIRRLMRKHQLDGVDLREAEALTKDDVSM